MADAPAYTTVPGKLPDLLKKIREAGVPTKANISWLESVGFKSSNDRSMLGVLRQIGFVDSSGTPTPAWKEYRGADHKLVLGRAIEVGYQDLYATYPDAHDRPNTDLGHVFSTRTTAGKQTIDKMVATFKSLVGQAEFGTASAVSAPSAAGQESEGVALETTGNTTLVSRATTTPTGMTVNINIQLTLPESKDGTTYEAFFRAMREHLLSDGA